MFISKFTLKVIIFFFIIYFVNSCTSHHPGRHKKIHIKEYKVYDNADENVESFIWYYIILTNNDSYYYYSSPTKVTDFEAITWLPSKVNPLEKEDIEEAEEENDISLDEESANITPEIESEVSNETSEGDDDTGDSDGSPSDGDAGNSGGGDGGGDGGGGE